MSYSLDANILLYASDSSSPFYARADAFLKSCAANRDPLYLAWSTVMAYLRISTHPSIFSSPLSPADATENIDALLALSHVRLISEGDNFWEIYRELSAGQVVRGKVVPDAHLAAIMKENEVSVLYTADNDFRRFKFIEVRNPFE